MNPSKRQFTSPAVAVRLPIMTAGIDTTVKTFIGTVIVLTQPIVPYRG